MKKYLLISILFFFLQISVTAQNRKGQLHLDSKSEKHILYVSFSGDINFSGNNYTEELSNQVPELKKIISNYQLAFEKGIPLQDQSYTAMERRANKSNLNASSVQKLKNILKVNMPFSSNEKLMEIAKKLEQFDIVEYCNLTSLKPTLPPTDIAPTTPDYESQQGYLESATGVNMRYAWNLGLNGAGIRVRDIEYGFNKNHEELFKLNVSIAAGMDISNDATQTYTEHGTSVFGIVCADKGSYGVSGMAYGVSEMILYPEWQNSGYDRINAITKAIENSKAGDVIIFEMQMQGALGDMGPAEYDQVVWDLTKAASDSGIIIVAAAGNGIKENLDDPAYNSYNARGNSGAIIVGAGTPDANHNRTLYTGYWGSTYGSRVDLQGWGANVVTTGSDLGNFIKIGNDFNQGYTKFSGTSSATPMVASCAIVLQSYYFSKTGKYLNSTEMKTFLKESGTPQGKSVAGNVGPFPNMQAAINAVDASLGIKDYLKISMGVFPNPTKDKLNIEIYENLSTNATIEIINQLGQVILKTNVSEGNNELDLASIQSGIYFLRLADSNKMTLEKIIKM